MKSVSQKRKILLPLLVLIGLFICSTTYSQKVWDGGGDGVNWSSANNWNPNGVPASTDAVTIALNNTVTVDVATAVCNTLQLGGTAINTRATLTFAATGSPKLVVTGAVTVGGSGSTNVNRGGTITFVSGATLEAGSIILTKSTGTDAPGVITMTAGSTLKTGSFALGNGTGTWTPSTGLVIMSATNTLPGSVFTTFNDLTIQTGTTRLGVNTTINDVLSLSSGNLDVNSFTASAGELTGSGNLTNTGSADTFTIGSANTSSTYSGVISATTAANLSIIKTGTGTLTLTGTNTYAGVTTINNGVLSVATIGNGGVAGNLGQASNAATNIVLGGGTLQYTGATASTNRNYTLTGGTTSVIEITTNTLTISGASTATSGALTKTGNGTLIVSGANLHTGLTTINAGTLGYGASNALSSGAVAVNDGGTYNLFGFSDTIGALTVNSGITGGTVATGAGTLTLGGNITSTGGATNASISGTIALGATRNFAVTNSADGLTVSAVISGATFGVTKTGAGILIFTGANTYTGATTISAGTLVLGASGVIANTSNVVLSGGVFSTGLSTGNAETVGTLGLTASSTIDLGTGTHALNFAASNGVGWTAAQIITVKGWTGNYATGTSGTAGQLFIGTSAAGLTSAQLGQMQFFDGTDYYPAKILATGEVVPYTPAATTYYAIASTAWNLNTTWSLTSGGTAVGAAIFPKAGDTVNIGEAAGRAVTVPAGFTARCATLNIGLTTTAGPSSLTLSAATAVLNVTGNITVNKPSAAATNVLAVNDGIATVGGNITLAGNTTTTTRISSIVINAGTLTVSGDLVMIAGVAANNSINMSGGAGTLNLAGAFTATAGTLTPGATSTFNYNGAAQTVTDLSAISYNHLILSGTGVKTLQTAMATLNDLTLSGTASATMVAGLSLTGNLTVGAGTTFSTGATNTWTLGVAGATSISGTLTLSNTATKTFTGDVVIGTGGVWNETGVCAVNYGGSFQHDGATFTANTGIHTFSGTGKTISGNNTIAIPNLTISGTTTNNGVLTVSTALSGSSTFTNGATGTLNYGGGSVAGTLTLNATAAGNLVHYNGTTQTVKNTAYNNLILSGNGTKTFTAAVTIGANLAVNTPAKITFPNTTTSTANTLTFDGLGQASGSWGGTTSGATNINTAYFNTALNGRINIATGSCTAGVWLGGTSTNWGTAANWCGGVPTASTDVVILAGTPFQPTIPTATTAVCRNLTINPSATLTISNNASSLLNISGDFTNNGTFVPGTAGTVSFLGTAAQVITGNNAVSFYHLTINTGTAPITVTNASKVFAVAGNLTVTRGNLTLLATDADYLVTGNLSVGTNGTLTHNVDWDAVGKLLGVSGNIAIDGVYSKGSAGRSHVQMTGSTKTVHTGTSSLNIFTLYTTGAIAADGALTVDNNFWAMEGIGGGSFSTNGQTVVATGALLNSGGTVNINGGSLTVTGGIQVGFNPGLGGTFNLSSGTLTTDAIALGASGTINGVFNHSGGTFTINGAMTIITSTPASTYICTGSPTINITGNWTNNGTYTKATETINFNGNTTISGSSTHAFHNVTIGNTLIAPAALNVSGTWTNNGTFTNSSGLVTFNGSIQQNVTGSIATTFHNVTLSNTAGAVLNTDQTINNTLSLTGGNLNLGSKILTLGAAAPAITGTFSATRMIVADGGGQIRKNATSNATASYTFPIGDANGTAEFSPVTLTTTGSAYSSAYIGVSVSDTKHPDNASATHYLSRYWNVNQSGITGCTVTIVGTYINTVSDVPGTLASTRAAQLNGTFNALTNPWVKTGGSVLSGATLTYTGAAITSGQTSVFTGITSADPTVSITGGNVTVCQNASTTLTAVPVGDAVFSYSWTGSITGSTTASTASATTSSVGGPNSYTLTVRDGNGIVSVASTAVTVTVTALPVAGTLTPTVSAGPVCEGTSVAATLTAGSGGSGSVIDQLEVSLSGGSYTAYVSGTPLSTTGQTTVSIRTRRTATGSGCTTSGYTTVAWTVNTASAGGSISGGTTSCALAPVVLTLSGNTGSVNHWESSVSPFTSWTTIVNTATTYTANPAVTTQYRAVVQNSPCSSANSSTATITIGAATTWDGTSWSSGSPSSSSAVTFTGNYTATTDLDYCSIVVDSGAIVTIPSGYNVSLNGPITVTSGSFTLESNCNLLQPDFAVNSGNIIVKRTTAALMRQDYVLWSSPVTGQQLQSFSPSTLATRFYTYNAATDQYAAVSSPSTTSFSVGTGYLIRMPNNHPATPLAWEGTFTGTPHNATVNLTSLTSSKYYAIGNPYPSTIDADKFITDNGLTDALYLWRKTNNTATTSYATYTLAGGVSNSGGDPLLLIPNGYLQVGQGFIARTPSSSTSLHFDNTMRTANNGNQFLRSVENRSRFWLNLTNTEGFFGQTMVAYMPNATSGVDAAIDGKFFNDSQNALTSLINNEEYTIQGRALPFDVNDVVALGFKSLLAGTYTIALNSYDGLFETQAQAIYIKDNLTNAFHELNSGAYTFTTEAGVFNTRFEIVFRNLLAIEQPVFTADQVVVYKKNQECIVDAGQTLIRDIAVYDMLGRLLIEKQQLGSTTVRFGLPATREALIVKVTSDQGEIVSKKIIN